jgi:lipase/uncharacterized protein/lipase (class 2)
MSFVCLSGARALRLIVLLLAGIVLALSGGSAAHAASFDQNPILFVHGIEGSGAQFESQKMRFTSNGYPESWIDEVDYNSTRAVGDTSEVDQQIDAAITALQQRTGKSQVDVVAHSLGTTVMYGYLTDSTLGAQRRANVSHYINVDGQSQNPGVPTLAVWAGRGTPGRNMAGAQNVTIPNQTHVQTCTSAESFVEYYKFLTGEPPVYDILRQSGPIEVAGRALNFPENSGALGATVQVWPLDDNGQRTSASPLASIPITDNSTGGGAWGPVTVQAGTRYEFALVTTGLPTLHIYREPFVRSDYAIRLLQSVAIENDVGNRLGSASGVNIRYKELWGNQGSENDQLLIDGLNICTPTLCPISKQVNAFFVYDINRDGQTDLSAPDPTLSALPFITGADVYMRGSDPPDDTISLQLISRGTGPTRTLNIPNWDSVGDGFTVQWDDFENTVSLDGYARPRGASPVTIALVPAYEECTSASGSHGSPLASPSCSPATQGSHYLTVGTPDANGKASNAAGKLELRSIGENPIDPNNGDQADVGITTTFTDVRNKSDLSDYTGELRVVLGLRITDRYNGDSLDYPATLTDTPFAFNVPCSATTGPAGGSCSLTTTADAVMPDVVREGKRAVWALGRNAGPAPVQVFDGGPDGDGDTADNTLFATQGLFAP